MEIVTREYRVDLNQLRRVSIRENYRTIWFAVVGGVGMATVFLFAPDRGMKVAGVVTGIFLACAPALRSVYAIHKVRNAPLYKLVYQATFDEERLVQRSEGQIRSQIFYSELIRVRVAPEGFLVYASKLSYSLISRDAFKSEEDFDAVKAKLASAGLIK